MNSFAAAPRAFFLIFTLLAMAWSPPVRSASDTEALTQMLNEFLAGASVNDAAAHDRFWAEDLVYTSSSGLRFGKAQIMEGLDDGGEPSEDQPSVVYTAENILIRQYADTAVVAFRLLGTPQQGDAKLKQYFNTGTFVRRNGEWRVVAWQATIIPETE